MTGEHKPSKELVPVEVDPVLFWAQHTLTQYRDNLGFSQETTDKEMAKLREAS